MACSFSRTVTLLPVTSQVIARVRRQFDVDCDPQAVHEGIASLDDAYRFIELGATRLGTSRIVKLVKNEEATGY